MLPKVDEGARVGIFGGSFDPPHLGHQLLALSALSLADIDFLWVFPCASHSFGKKLTAFEHRFHMCELAFQHLENVTVVDIEQKLPAPNLSVRTLQAILAERPDLQLKFVMGSDLLDHFESWEGAENIKQMAPLWVFDRAALLPQVSGTSIRPALKEQRFEWLDLQVQSYIRKYELYTAK